MMGDDRAGVPLEVVDGLLATIAQVLHDRPVQQLVAARLLLESSGGSGPMFDKGLSAVSTGGQLSRDIMWAVTRVPLEADAFELHLQDTFERAADPDQGLEMRVTAPTELPTVVVEGIVHACHDVVADAVMRGGSLRRLDAAGEPGRLRMTVVTRDGREDGPWVELARRRVRLGGGRLTVERDGDDIITVLEAP